MVDELWDGTKRTGASFRVVASDEAFGILSKTEKAHKRLVRFFWPRMYPGYDFTGRITPSAGGLRGDRRLHRFVGRPLHLPYTPDPCQLPRTTNSTSAIRHAVSAEMAAQRLFRGGVKLRVHSVKPRRDLQLRTGTHPRQNHACRGDVTSKRITHYER